MVIKNIPDKNFFVQTEPDNCLPTCIKNILFELSIRHKNEKLNGFKLSKIAKLCGYRKYCASTSEIAVPSMNTLLKKHNFKYVAKEKYGPKVTIEELKSICENDSTSLVVVSMPKEYFKERILNYKADGSPEYEHTIIVQSVDSSDVIIYDTLESFYNKTPKAIKLKDKKINRTKFESYWARTLNWMIWIEKIEEKRGGLLKYFKK